MGRNKCENFNTFYEEKTMFLDGHNFSERNILMETNQFYEGTKYHKRIISLIKIKREKY
jgi:hypothetical protein